MAPLPHLLLVVGSQTLLRLQPALLQLPHLLLLLSSHSPLALQLALEHFPRPLLWSRRRVLLMRVQLPLLPLTRVAWWKPRQVQVQMQRLYQPHTQLRKSWQAWRQLQHPPLPLTHVVWRQAPLAQGRLRRLLLHAGCRPVL